MYNFWRWHNLTPRIHFILSLFFNLHSSIKRQSKSAQSRLITWGPSSCRWFGYSIRNIRVKTVFLVLVVSIRPDNGLVIVVQYIKSVRPEIRAGGHRPLLIFHIPLGQKCLSGPSSTIRKVIILKSWISYSCRALRNTLKSKGLKMDGKLLIKCR